MTVDPVIAQRVTRLMRAPPPPAPVPISAEARCGLSQRSGAFTFSSSDSISRCLPAASKAHQQLFYPFAQTL